MREGEDPAQRIALAREHVGAICLLAEGADIGEEDGFGRYGLHISEFM